MGLKILSTFRAFQVSQSCFIVIKLKSRICQMSNSSSSMIDINSLFSPESTAITTIVMDCLAFLTVFTSSFIIYLILKQTPSMMTTYKKYLFLHTMVTIIYTIVMAAGKPQVIYRVYIGICAGFIPVKTEFGTRLFFTVWAIVTTWIATSLTLIHIERFFAIHYEYTKCRFSICRPTSFIVMYGVLIVIIDAIVIASFVAGDLYIGGDAARETLLQQVAGGEEFLEKYPGAIIINRQMTPWTISFHFALIFMIGFTFISLLIFLSMNIITGFKTIQSENFSETTKKVHKSILRTSMFQVLFLFVFVAFPMIPLLVTIVTNYTLNFRMEFSITILQVYPLIDNVVVILIVKPYRDFVFKYLRRDSVTEFSTN